MGLEINTKNINKPKNKVGLDIGSYALKMIDISEAQDKSVLNGMGMKKVSGLAREEVPDAIKALASEIRLTTKEAAISVSGQSVVVRFVSMPKMNENELRNAMSFEAEKYIPFNIKDCVFDFNVIKNRSAVSGQGHGISGRKDGDEGKLNILLAVAKKDYVDDKIGIAERAGLTVTTVDIDSFALANSFGRNFPASENQDKVSALLNIGARSANLSILKGDNIVFVRDSAMGSKDFNEAISKTLGISPEAAEDVKVAGEDERLKVCIKPVLTALLDDIKLSFGYYENQSGRSIDDLYVSGGGIGTAGLDEALQDIFNTKPNYWNPIDFLEKNSANLDIKTIEKIKNYFAVATGLALR